MGCATVNAGRAARSHAWGGTNFLGAPILLGWALLLLGAHDVFSQPYVKGRGGLLVGLNYTVKHRFGPGIECTWHTTALMQPLKRKEKKRKRKKRVL